MGPWAKSFTPLPMSHGAKAILGNQSLASATGLLSHLLPRKQPLGLGLASVAPGTQGERRTSCNATRELGNHGRKK